MTDKEEFIKFLEKFNIPYHSKEHNYDDYINGDGNTLAITADDDETDKIEGYMGFHCTIIFDENNKFKKIGIWE